MSNQPVPVAQPKENCGGVIDPLSTGSSFNSILKNISCHGSHFLFNNEKSWSSQDMESPSRNYFSLNVVSLANNISQISSCDKQNLYKRSSSISQPLQDAMFPNNNPTKSNRMFNDNITLAERMDELESQIIENDINIDQKAVTADNIEPTTPFSRTEISSAPVEALPITLNANSISNNTASHDECEKSAYLEEWLDSILDD